MQRLRQPAWIALQVAIAGSVLWLAYGTEEGRRQNFGMAPGVIAVVLAFVVTAMIVIYAEIYQDLRRRWLVRRQRLSGVPDPLPDTQEALGARERQRPPRLP